jgi:hypothetical protein
MSILSWAGTYRKSDCNSVDTGKFEILGAGVLFSTLVAIVNWGFAGYSNSLALPEQTRWIIAVTASLFGALTIFIFDRGFIYISDIQSPEKNLIKTLVFSTIRLLIVIAISSVTANALIPLLLKQELSVEALKMQELSEKQRVAGLSAVYQINDKEKSLASSASEVEQYQNGLLNLPADIVDKIQEYKTCWINYKHKKKALETAAFSINEMRASLSAFAAKCHIRENLAKNARNDYLTLVRLNLTQAQQKQQRTYSALLDAESAIKQKTAKAERIENSSLTANSVLVLESLLKTNEAARYKYYLLTLLLICFELLPILLKFMMGQSNTGYKVYADSRYQRMEIEAALEQKMADFEISQRVSKMAVNAINTAINSPEIQAIFIQEFSKIAGAAAPFEAVRTLLNELSSRQQDVDQFVQTYPRFATVVTTAFNNALKESVSILGELSTAQARANATSWSWE